jgi:DNA-binding MarR family transcriptional regulator
MALDVLPRIVRVLTHASTTSAPGEEPLTLTQFRLLRELALGPLLTGELAARLDVTAATVSAAIDGLVRRGMIERLPSAGDRRMIPLRRSPAGAAAAVAARERQGQALSALFASMSPDALGQLSAGLRALGRALDDGAAR